MWHEALYKCVNQRSNYQLPNLDLSFEFFWNEESVNTFPSVTLLWKSLPCMGATVPPPLRCDLLFGCSRILQSVMDLVPTLLQSLLRSLYWSSWGCSRFLRWCMHIRQLVCRPKKCRYWKIFFHLLSNMGVLATIVNAAQLLKAVLENAFGPQ